MRSCKLCKTSAPCLSATIAAIVWRAKTSAVHPQDCVQCGNAIAIKV